MRSALCRSSHPRRCRPALLLGLALALGVAAGAPSVARAAPPSVPSGEDEAFRAHEAGRQAFAAGRYAEAATQFAAALALVDDVNILWNLGLSLERSGELERAATELDRLLARRDVPPAMRKKAVDAEYRVRTKLDARAAAATPEALLPVLEAERAEALDADNGELATRLDGDIRALRARLVASGVVVPPRPGRSRLLEWTLVGSGGAALATGVVLWLVGEGDHAELRDAQAGAEDGLVSDMTRARALSLREDGDTFKAAGIATGLVGLAALGTGVVLLVLDDAPRTDARVEVGAAPLPGGMHVRVEVPW